MKEYMSSLPREEFMGRYKFTILQYIRYTINHQNVMIEYL